MPKTIISDTSCLIVLSNIGELVLLHKTYPNIITTVEVATEYGEALPTWIEVVAVKDKSKQELLELTIDKGESSAIALAMETPDSLVVLDDYKARKVADKLKVNYTGTIGIIIKAKFIGHITSIKPILEKLKVSGFRLSSEIEQAALAAANE